MTTSRFTAGALLFLFFHVANVSAFSLVDCKQANAEEGAKYCKEAFSHTYADNKMKFITSPVKSGCCLTLSLRSCVEHAFTKARCDPKDQKVAIMIKDQIKDAQNLVKNAVDSVTHLVCGDYKRESCEARFLAHFDEAIRNINVLNGSPSLQASLLATSVATLVASLYTIQWN